MEAFRLHLFFLSILGVWKPQGWHGIKAFFYSIYGSTVVIFNHIFILSGILNLVKFKHVSLDAFIDNFSTMLALIVVRQRIICVIENRNSISQIIESTDKSPFKLRDRQEKLIFSKFSKLAKNILIYYPIVHMCIILVHTLGHISVMDPPYALPFQGWFPYNYTRKTKIYWATAIYQLYAIFSEGSIDLILDLLLPCILCYMCGHIHILRHRFRVMTEKLQIMSENNEPQVKIDSAERKLMAEWVKYHIDILRLVGLVKKIFERMIFVQYTVSSLLLCTLAYLLSHTKCTTMTFAANFSFFMAMFIQILLPCYCADKLTFEFLDISTGIYNTNWYQLSNNIRRSVVVIIRYTYQPVTITSGFFIILSLESFTKIIKLAYTIYNLLE
ncbi:odorant receptor 94b-like [Microplitis mediator]|uniref:odorant receptor 94b-like n=1 Tax=Microplitis mediator TaxID=375433 RepID=UPI002555221D|nr:odorant receptor 94b-like [Microplitis mediator]